LRSIRTKDTRWQPRSDCLVVAMLSIASKRTLTLARPRKGLEQAVTKQRARLTTAASAGPANSNSSTRRLVVSRREWLDFKKSRGIARKPPDPSKRPISDDEKPWPRNVQIAGYVAGALAVPYTILWTITSNPTLREWFGPYLPVDKLRTHYGKLEWDAQTYVEQMEDARNKEKNGKPADSIEDSLIGYYQFPEEEPFQVRQQQKIIETMNNSDVAVTISTSSSPKPSPSQMEDIVTKTIEAKMIANEKNLLEVFSASLASTTNNMLVAVDFLDKFNSDNTTNGKNVVKPLSDGSLMTDIESSKSEGGYREPFHSPSASQQLAQETQTASKWTYTPSQQTDAGNNSKNGATSDSRAKKLTDVEMEIGRLGYEISELERSLRDPMCTRDIDGMTTELRNAKRELSKLKWKRRFGLA